MVGLLKYSYALVWKFLKNCFQFLWYYVFCIEGKNIVIKVIYNLV